MHTVAKKVYMSILTCIVILLTMVATTYAWVGILTSGQVSGFDLNLKIEDTNQSYSLLISNDGSYYVDDEGEHSSFGTTVELVDMQRQVLNNRGYETTGLTNDNITALFNRFAKLEPVSTSVNPTTHMLNTFYGIDRSKFQSSAYRNTIDLISNSEQYYTFDIYLSVDPKEGVVESTNINANVFLNDIGNVLEGNLASGQLINGSYFDTFPTTGPYSILKNMPKNFTINTINAARVAFSVYNPINISDSYTNENPVKTIIYQGGTQNPSIIDNVYNLGGIVDDQYNVALQEYNLMYNKTMTTDIVPAERRNDLELIEENKQLWDRDTEGSLSYLGVKDNVKTKMKITITLWFEGWDADCMYFLENKEIKLNLSFSTDSEI